MKKLLILLALFTSAAFGGPLDETRYCTDEPVRTEDGKIARSAQVIAAFKKAHPCPSTWLTYGACPDWNIDHVIPLAVGGCDAVSNMQWLPVSIKRCGEGYCKDRWERKIYQEAK